MARRGDTRSPSPTGSYSSRRSRRGDDRDRKDRDRRDHGRHARKRSRSPGSDVSASPHPHGMATDPKTIQRRYRDRDSHRDSYRREYRSPDRRDDRSYRSRKDRSRERHRSLARIRDIDRDRRRRSRDRDYPDRRDDSRDQYRRRRDDDRDGRNGRVPDKRAPEPSKSSAPAKQSEEEKKAERLAKLESWKQKQAAEKEKKQKEMEAKGGARRVLEEMDKKANEATDMSPAKSPSTPPVAASPVPYAGKFDPKSIAKKAAGSTQAGGALGEDVAVPQATKTSAASNSRDPDMPADKKKAAIYKSSSSKFDSPLCGAQNTHDSLKGTSVPGPLKAKGNVSGFGLGGKPQNESEKVPSKHGLDFGDDEGTRKRLEKLPTPPPEELQSNGDAALANGVEQEQDDIDEELAMADTEESDAAAARAAAERREERMLVDSHDASNIVDGDDGQVNGQTLQQQDQNGDAAMADPTEANMMDDAQNTEEDLDPLDAFMTNLDDSKGAASAPGLQTATKTKAKQHEPQAMFSDDEGDFDPANADSGNILEMASKARKKKDIPTVDHAKMDYEAFRKNFYTEPSELSGMTEEELTDLRLDLDGIKIRGVDVPKPVQKFSQCGLGVQSLEVLNRLGFEQPTSIQAQAIPAIMSGRDVIGIAKTGSGKTIAFLLPMFRHIKDQRPLEKLDGPIGLVMTPTRELATQIHKECKPWLKALNLRAVCAYGGAPIKDQIAELKRGAEIVVCTPGRMIDLLAANQGRVINLRRVTYTVLDEADRMFDMGFEPQVMKITTNIRPTRQTALFSATFPRNMEALARKTLSKPVEIVIGGRSVVAPEIKQLVEVRPENSKFIRLLQLLGELHEDEDARSLIFVDRQESAEELMNAILHRGYPCFTIHGGKDQYDRDSVISDFKAGVFPVLVATSVAARGLDVKQLKMVVNFDCPNHLEDYVHRAGRTGRAGNTGLAVTFITEEQERYSLDVAKALKQSGQKIPESLQKLVDAFVEKVKAGKEKANSSGFGGKGLEEVDKRADAARARERKAFKTGDEQDEDKEEKQKEEKKDDIVVKPAGSTSTQLVGVPQGIDLDGKITVHKTEAPPPGEGGKDRMKGVSDAVAAINARLRKTGDIRGNAPIDNKGPDAGAFHATLEINDFPQKARWAVTNRTNVAKILEATGTSITTKGNFYAAGATPGPNDAPKLYILVEGDTEVVVTNAMRELMRLLKDGTAAAMDSEARAPASGRYSVV